VLTNPAATDLAGNIVSNINDWRKSFKDVWIWLKGECLEVQGMIGAMRGREKMIEK